MRCVGVASVDVNQFATEPARYLSVVSFIYFQSTVVYLLTS